MFHGLLSFFVDPLNISIRIFYFTQFPPTNAFNKHITAKTAMSISQEIEIDSEEQKQHNAAK